jgi:DNA-binding CsgD family transcriptional regulator
MDPTDEHVVDRFRALAANAPAAPTIMPQKSKSRTAEAPCPSSADVTAVSSALSRISPSDSDWLLRIERAANSNLSGAPKCKALFIEIRDPHNPRIWTESRAAADVLDSVRNLVGTWPKSSVWGFAKRLLSGAKCFTVSTRLDEGLYKRWAASTHERSGARDALCVAACERPGAGVLLWFPLVARAALPRSTARRWEVIGKNLLQAVLARSGGTLQTDVSGDMLDGEGRDSEAPPDSAHLVAGVRAKVVERTTPVLSDVDASSFRRELLRGEWSLLDHFDSDGKRYFTWARAGGHADRRRSLTKRERDVLERVAMGQSDRSIGMELRCSSSTVATHRLRAMSKLGLRSRALFSQILASVAADEPS